MEILFDFLQEYKQKLKPLGFFAATVIGLYGMSVLFKVEPDEQEESEQRGKRPAGITNEGNTCFVNSLLQALSSVQTFKSNIQLLLKVKTPQDDNQELMVELNKVIRKINTGSEDVSVMGFLDILSRTQAQLINFQQQDTYELYSALVRAFDEFFNKRKQCNLSISHLHLQEDIIQNCLMGYTKSTIQCLACKNTMTIKNHSFYDLSLQIQPDFITGLKGALLWFQRKQKIQNYACTFCSVRAHIQKLEKTRDRLPGHKWKMQLTNVNEKLIDYLKRNPFQDMDLKQINQALQNQVAQFTNIFTIIGDDAFRNQTFSLIKPVERQILKQTRITKYPKFLVIHLKQLIINPYTGEPAYMKKPMQFPSCLQITQKTHTKVYKLTSLLTHIGNQQMGHYFTFRKPSKNSDQWFMISDTHTERVSQQKMKKYVPYMLFYELDSEDYNKDLIAKSMRQNQMLQGKKKFKNSLKNRTKSNRLSQEMLFDDSKSEEPNKQSAQIEQMRADN